MRRFAPLLLASALAIEPAAARTLCDDVAARLRADPSFTRSGSHVWPLDALVKQNFAQAATSSHAFDYEKGKDAYLALLAQDFGMDQSLVAAIKDASGFMQDEVWSLDGSPLHAFMDSFGTADCETYVFFQDGHKLADPPDTMWGGMTDYASRPVEECLMSQGTLARIGGTVAFVATDREAPYNFNVALRITTFENGAWSPVCRAAAAFETLYRVKAVYRPADGPLSEAAIREVAPGIARARDRARPRLPEKQKDFVFGPPLARADRGRLMALSKAKPAGVADLIPTFGAKPDEDANIGNDRDDFPVTVAGKPYLVRIAHPSIGWRDFYGYSLIFFRPDGAAVASAFVDQDRGKPVAIKAVALAP